MEGLPVEPTVRDAYKGIVVTLASLRFYLEQNGVHDILDVGVGPHVIVVTWKQPPGIQDQPIEFVIDDSVDESAVEDDRGDLQEIGNNWREYVSQRLSTESPEADGPARLVREIGNNTTADKGSDVSAHAARGGDEMGIAEASATARHEKPT